MSCAVPVATAEEEKRLLSEKTCCLKEAILKDEKPRVIRTLKQELSEALKKAAASESEALEDRQLALAIVSAHGACLRFLGETLRNDPEIVSAALGNLPDAFEHAGDLIKSNRNFVLGILKNGRGRLLRFASEALRADREVVHEAVKDNWAALQFACPELRGVKTIVLEAVKERGGSLGLASWEMQADKEIVLHAVRQDGLSLRSASPELRADKDIVLEAVKQNGVALFVADEELKADRDVVVEAVKKNYVSLSYASQTLRGDKDLLLLTARESRPRSWYHCYDLASDSLRASLPRESFFEVCSTSIAVRGESAPILTLSLTEATATAAAAAAAAAVDAGRLSSPGLLSCEVTLLSGLSFNLQFTIGLQGGDDDLAQAEVANNNNNNNNININSNAEAEGAAAEGKKESAEESAAPTTIAKDRNWTRGDLQLPMPKRARLALASGSDEENVCERCAYASATAATTTTTTTPPPTTTTIPAAAASAAATTTPSSIANVADLAKIVLAELKKQKEVSAPRRIFIIFDMGDSPAVPVTPWDWDRPLTDFVCT